MADPTLDPAQPISDEEFRALLARLEAKQEEFLVALHALSKAGVDDGPHSVTDTVFRLLGIVTFWLSTKKAPSRKMAADVDKALRMFNVRVQQAVRS